MFFSASLPTSDSGSWSYMAWASELSLAIPSSFSASVFALRTQGSAFSSSENGRSPAYETDSASFVGMLLSPATAPAVSSVGSGVSLRDSAAGTKAAKRATTAMAVATVRKTFAFMSLKLLTKNKNYQTILHQNTRTEPTEKI